MSWPDDNLPRFVVATVTGHRINPAAGGSSVNRIREVPITAQVLDRAYCDRVVATFDQKRRSTGGVIAEAIGYAAALNEREGRRAA